MIQEKYENDNQEYIERFLEYTKHRNCVISESVKATIVEFLARLKENLYDIGLKNKETIGYDELIQCQIDQLRACVIDLQTVLNSLKTARQ